MNGISPPEMPGQVSTTFVERIQQTLIGSYDRNMIANGMIPDPSFSLSNLTSFTNEEYNARPFTAIAFTVEPRKRDFDINQTGGIEWGPIVGTTSVLADDEQHTPIIVINELQLASFQGTTKRGDQSFGKTRILDFVTTNRMSCMSSTIAKPFLKVTLRLPDKTEKIALCYVANPHQPSDQPLSLNDVNMSQSLYDAIATSANPSASVNKTNKFTVEIVDFEPPEIQPTGTASYTGH